MSRPRLFERQLHRLGLSTDTPPSAEQWQRYLACVDRTYTEAEQDRYTLERSLAISSREMRELYDDLKRSSERLLAEKREMLMNSVAIHDAILEAALDGVLVVDSQQRVVAHSKRFVELWRLTEEEIVALDRERRVAAFASRVVDPDGFAARIQEIYSRPEQSSQDELHLLDGRTIDRLSAPVRSGASDTYGRVWFFRDITSRKHQEEHSRRIEEQLRQSQKMDAIGQLAGGVAHDFNNILAAILGSAELVLDDLGDDHQATADVKEIEAAALRAAELTRQLLAFSRQQAREVTVLSVNSVVTGVEKMLMRILGEDIDMSVVLAPQLGSVEAHAGQVEQVLMNLVVNARDAMPRGGRLTIETSNTVLDEDRASQLGVAPGPFVMLVVSDTGMGMDRETQARVFEPFFTTKPVGKGTGLGLSTVFGIVRQSNGAISIDSELARGSTFRVYLPRLERAARMRPVSGKNAAVPAADARRILVVEDDDRLRAVIGRQLTSWGYSFIDARNAETALELLRNTRDPVDLLLTDLVMPGIDGRALATKVLAGRPQTKVLFMSGYTEHAAIKTAALGTKDQFIAKPFTANKLSSAIRAALEG